jgi:ribosomal protein S18 acetylase RimI-like enzyme
MEGNKKLIEVITVVRQAILDDIPDIMRIVQQTITEMRVYNNTQWDESYPRESDFAADIEKRDLYAVDRDGRLAGFICVNRVEPVEYDGLTWSRNCSTLVIHRMAVDTDCRRNGVGIDLLKHAEWLADRDRIEYLKTDTNSLNSNAQKLFEKYGYRKVGAMSAFGKETPFYCYEKSLAR